jgi:exosome complex RNA-binding protein Rrp4
MADAFQRVVVLPGENVNARIAAVATDVKVGRGLDNRVVAGGTGAAAAGTNVTATKAGVFRFQAKNRFWVDSDQKRYVPVMDDVVIGVVASRHAENYKVDVGASSLVQLDALAFDGASKRNKPNLQVGDIVYARVILVRGAPARCCCCCLFRFCWDCCCGWWWWLRRRCSWRCGSRSVTHQRPRRRRRRRR